MEVKWGAEEKDWAKGVQNGIGKLPLISNDVDGKGPNYRLGLRDFIEVGIKILSSSVEALGFYN